MSEQSRWSEKLSSIYPRTNNEHEERLFVSRLGQRSVFPMASMSCIINSTACFHNRLSLLKSSLTEDIWCIVFFDRFDIWDKPSRPTRRSKNQRKMGDFLTNKKSVVLFVLMKYRHRVKVWNLCVISTLRNKASVNDLAQPAGLYRVELLRDGSALGGSWRVGLCLFSFYTLQKYFSLCAQYKFFTKVITCFIPWFSQTMRISWQEVQPYCILTFKSTS